MKLIKEFIVHCKKCGAEYKVYCSQKDFENDKYSHYCCIACRNSHKVSEETKKKISSSLQKRKEIKHRKCVFCGDDFIPNGREKFCCKKCKQMYNILYTLKKYFNFDISALGTKDAYKEVENIKNDLYVDYWINELSSTEINEKYNYSAPANITGKLFKYLGIPSRTLKQQTILSFLKGKYQNNNYVFPYKQQWHTTWNSKKVFLRSSYELDFANELDEKQIDYDVETLRIRYFNSQTNDYHCAIPDFYLKDTNTIIEIKSNYTLDILEMKDKVKAYKELGYNFKLILEHQDVDINDL